jgi:hypothetical protein
MKAAMKRELKRMVRRAAPGLANRLGAALRAARGTADVHDVAHFGRFKPKIQDSQRKFDEKISIDAAAVAQMASNSSIVVVGMAPFDNVLALVEELHQEKLDIGEVIVVDATAEQPRLVAIRDHVEAWKRRLPLTRFKVAPYSLQDVRFPEAIAQGWPLATRPNVWVVGCYDVPLDCCFTYLFKTLLAQKGGAVVVTRSVAPDAKPRHIEVAPHALGECEPVILEAGKSARLVANAIRSATTPASSLEGEQRVDAFSEGIFGGPRTLLQDENGALLDTRLMTNLSVFAMSQRLKANGVPIVRSGGAFSRSLLGKLTDGGPLWESIHDLRRIESSGMAPARGEAERIDIVCPFHRGDVILAVQVAACATSAGKNVRLHVAEPLVSWAKEFGGGVVIEPVPVPVASAEETYPVLLDSYQYVSMRRDAVPHVVRFHPSRHLSDTGRNLVEYMLAQVGLPPETRLPNLVPSSTDEQRRIAHELVEAIGGDIVFVHPLGGWHLKSIPPHVMAELAEEMHRAGLKLIQIGAEKDSRVEHTDGAILKNFMPSQWKEILALGRALICVDSWTSHFGAMLDMPQICMYGSTHPAQVSSKRWFRSQTAQCLNLGPIVNCSPCNSLTCVSYPDRDYCTGYAVDRTALRTFLAEQLTESD